MTPDTAELVHHRGCLEYDKVKIQGREGSARRETQKITRLQINSVEL